MTRREFVRLLPAAAANPPAIGVRSDGMLAIGGKRTFILGLYQLPRVPDAWGEVARAGFNLVRANPADLARARENGLYGWIALGSIRRGREAEDEARIRQVVEGCRLDPALRFRETEDEPTFVWKKPGELRVPPDEIIPTRRFAAKLDPGRPFWLNHSPTDLLSALRLYHEGAEITATDIYPVIPQGIGELYAVRPDGRQGDWLNSDVSRVGQYADKMRRVARPGRAVGVVLQAFAWENLREKDRDPRMVLYPTRGETRFMAWQSVVHGVNGILYWGLAHNPPDAPIWEDLKQLAAEFRLFREELAAPAARLDLTLHYHDTGHSLDR